MIFLVEDNPGIRETVTAYLELAGHGVREFEGTQGVLEAMAFQMPGLVVLDVNLPDGNGFALARRIRQHHPQVPFLFLTAREAESDRITGLELGAEDYVIKPFSPRELSLRVQAILRRTAGDPGGGLSTAVPGVPQPVWTLEGHRLEIDPQAHEVCLDSSEVKLTATEWSILRLLSAQAGQVVSRERILGECLDYLHDGSDRTVNTHIKNLRAKLGAVEWIQTIRGFGYKFVGQS